MAYNTKYKLQFDSDGRTITVDFMFRDFIGTITNVLGPSSPAIQKWNTDDPFDAVRGSSLDIELFATSTLSIFNFQTNDDDGVKVLMYYSGETLFEGFLVQDDFSESVVEYVHTISLSATDNLGLLKEVSILTANKTFGDYRNKNIPFIITSASAQDIVTLQNDITFVPLPGEKLIITGTNQPFDGLVFTIVSSLVTGNDLSITVNEPLLSYGIFGGATVTYFLSKSVNLEVKQSLATMFALCLNATNLKLNADVYIRLQHESSFAPIFTQTYIRPEDFKNGAEYSSCYDFIAGVLTAFNACIFQRGGKWVIIRFIELVYGSSFYERFNSDFILTAFSGTYNGAITYGGNSILAAPLQQLQRPFKYVEQKFEFKEITRTLVNANLTELGALLRTYTTGTGINFKTFKEYAELKYSSGFFWNIQNSMVGQNTTNFYIRVITDYRGDEIDRYIVIQGNPGFDPVTAVVLPLIEVNGGDKIEFNITIKTSNSIPGPYNRNCILNNISHLPLLPRSPYWVLKQSRFWEESSNPNFRINFENGENANQWKSFSIESFELPTDGRLYVYLPQISNVNGIWGETHVKGLSLKYIPQILGQRSVKGHVHKDTQFANIKNKKEISLLVDDTLSNAILGTLFKPPAGLLIDDRTRKWRRDPVTEEKRLGEITSIEREFIRNVSRKRVEVSLLDIFKSGFISPYNKVSWDRYSNDFFLFGNLEIDYGSNRAKGTLYELYKVGENLTNLHTYTFNYLYE